jgi:hypothetical protein
MYKYHTNWKGYPLMIAIASIVVLISPFFSKQVLWNNPRVLIPYLIVAIVYIFLSVSFFIGMYVSVDSTYVTKTTYFFFVQKIKFADIEEVRYSPAFIIDEKSRVLFIIPSNPHLRTVRLMTNRFYKTQDLNNVLKVLRDKAPQAKFNINN